MSLEARSLAPSHPPVSLHPNGTRFAVATTNPVSNGNSLDTDSKYAANSLPIKMIEFPMPV